MRLTAVERLARQLHASFTGDLRTAFEVLHRRTSQLQLDVHAGSASGSSPDVTQALSDLVESMTELVSRVNVMESTIQAKIEGSYTLVVCIAGSRFSGPDDVKSWLLSTFGANPPMSFLLLDPISLLHHCSNSSDVVSNMELRRKLGVVDGGEGVALSAVSKPFPP